MDIYFGKFLKSDKFLLSGASYTMFFDTEQAVFDHENHLRELGSCDILEYVGRAEFNKRGILVPNEKTAKRVYDPDGEEDGNNEGNEEED